MSKVLNYFRLRMGQLSHDPSAITFAYVLPILALCLVGVLASTGITTVSVHYATPSLQTEGAAVVKERLDALSARTPLRFLPVDAGAATLQKVNNNEISFYLEYEADGDAVRATLWYNRKDSNNEAYAMAIEAAVVGSGATVEKKLVSRRGFSYLDVFLPGMLGFTAMFIGLTGFGGYILQDRFRGVFKKLKTIDSRPFSYLAGIGLSRYFALSSLFVVFAILGTWVFHYEFQGNWFLGLALFTLMSTVFLALGLLVSGYAKSIESYNGLAGILQIVFIVTGGSFFSLEAYPQVVQDVLKVFPLGAFSSGFQSLAAQPDQLMTWLIPLAILGAWAALLVPWSLRRFKW